ncbi:MAG: DUF5696 domain-containing protein [Kiritimatiellia bacterium]|jgi:hypothetical protein
MRKSTASRARTAGPSAVSGFSFGESGIQTPRGPIAWNEVIALRLYNRPEQKYLPAKGVAATVRRRTDSRVILDCFEPVSQTYVPLELVLDGTYLRVKFLAGDIVEPLGSCWRLMKVEILPSLLDARASEKGGYVTPLFTGSIARFQQEKELVSVDRVYMQQSEWEKMGLLNAFGIFGPKGGILGIVHGGEFRAWIETACGPERASQRAVIGIRDLVGDPLEFEEKEVLFRAVSEAKDYAPLALAFGEYLRNERGLEPIVERRKSAPQMDAMTDAMRINLFIGMKRPPFRTDGTSPYFSSTTFAEAEKIVDAIHAAGIRKAWFTLVGWINEGHDGVYPSHFPVNPAAGGEEGLRKLIAKIKSYGWAVTPHDNIHSIYMRSTDRDMSVVSRDECGEYQPMGVWSGGLTYMACPQVWIHRYGGDFSRIRELGFDGVYYIDALGTGLFRCRDKDHPANEKEFALGQLKLLGWVRALFGTSATETPAVYTLKYIDFAGNGASGPRVWSKRRLTGDTLELLDRYVPFWNIAVHGIIQYHPNVIHGYRGRPEGILGMYADGGVPWMEVVEHAEDGVIGDDWRKSLADIVEPYRVIYELVPELKNGVTTAFEELAPDAVHWTFDNGIEMFVNATGRKVGSLKPMSLQILRKGKTVYALG